MTPTTAPSRGPVRGSRTRRLALLGGPTTRPISGKRLFPLYGLIHHIGRKSGHEYSTPVVVRQAPDAMYVPLPFGERTDWYRNAVAAGGLRVTWKGRDHWLANPTIVDRDTARAGFNRFMRGIMGFAGIELVVRFDPIE
jgi:deazaflavin-dependent oxidoreductase (nitroreductase family)